MIVAEGRRGGILRDVLSPVRRGRAKCCKHALQRTGSVQQKLSCLFETVVIETASSKRAHQPYKVVAGDEVRSEALQSDIHNSLPTEKLDGTCVYAGLFRGRSWLYARLDRKPNKAGEKRFKKRQTELRQWVLAGRPEGGSAGEAFVWDVERDFKQVPREWIPAHGVGVMAGVPQPDANGHIPGWVPLEPEQRQYCWHLSAVDLEKQLAIVLQQSHSQECPESHMLEIAIVPLRDIVDKTLELVGTNVNGNAYHMGSKQQPLHLYTVHGNLVIQESPPQQFSDLKRWFQEEADGQIEGVVWHCSNGSMFKVHRHHLELPWPVPKPRLCSQPVVVNVDLDLFPGMDFSGQALFHGLASVNGQKFDNLTLVKWVN